jgi:putative copper export protein
MAPVFWLNVLTRWLHVASAVVGIGALVFLRLVLQPALASQEPSVRQAVMDRVMPRFKRVIHSALGLLLLTGFYNFMVAMPKVAALEYRSLYHPIIGTKILLALILFGIVTMALSSSPASGNMQERRSGWLTVTVVLALVILLLSATLRRLWDYRATASSDQSVVQPSPGRH